MTLDNSSLNGYNIFHFYRKWRRFMDRNRKRTLVDIKGKRINLQFNTTHWILIQSAMILYFLFRENDKNNLLVVRETVWMNLINQQADSDQIKILSWQTWNERGIVSFLKDKSGVIRGPVFITKDCIKIYQSWEF